MEAVAPDHRLQDRQALRVALAGSAALAVAMGIGRFAFTPLLPMMEEDAGLTLSAAGWLAAANYVGYLVGAVVAFGFRGRAGKAIRAALAVTGVATVAAGFGESVGIWICLRFIAGVASAWALIFASAWAFAELERCGRRALGGVVFGGVGAGIAVVGLVCAAAMALGAGSSQVWIALGGVAVAVSVALRPVFADADAPPRRAAATLRFRWTSDASRLAVCYGAFGMSYIVPATFLPEMAKTALGDPALFGWAWPIFGGASMAGTLLAARWTARVGNRNVWRLSHAVMAVGLALPVLPLGFLGIALGALLIGGAFMPATMTALAEARVVGGNDAEPFIAAMTAAFAAGQIVGPVLASASVAQSGSYAPAMAAAGVLLLLSAAALKSRPGGLPLATFPGDPR